MTKTKDMVFNKTELFRQLKEWERYLPDGLDAAIIGISSCRKPKPVYSFDKIIDILMEGGMNDQEANEHFESLSIYHKQLIFVYTCNE
jgi:hypothetical protein|tara:strand:+ start:120 stop:383 length:264 start_codon:yes stop_codon:yes gene_type:complete